MEDHDFIDSDSDVDKIMRKIYSQCDTEQNNRVPVSKLIDYMRPFFQANLSDLDHIEAMMDPNNEDQKVSKEEFITTMSTWATRYNREDSFHNLSQQDFDNPPPLVESTPRKSFGARQQRVYAEAVALDMSSVEQEITVASANSLEKTVLEEQIKQLTYEYKKCNDELEMARSQILSQEEQNSLLQSEIDKLNSGIKLEHETIENLMKEIETVDELRDTNLNNQRCIDKMQKQLVQFEKENQQLKIENKDLENERIKTEEKITRIHDTLATCRKETIELRAELNMKDEELLEVEKSKSKLKDEIKKLQAHIENLEEEKNCTKIENDKVVQLYQEKLKKQQDLINNMTGTSSREYTPARRSSKSISKTPHNDKHTTSAIKQTKNTTKSRKPNDLHEKHKQIKDFACNKSEQVSSTSITPPQNKIPTPPKPPKKTQQVFEHFVPLNKNSSRNSLNSAKNSFNSAKDSPNSSNSSQELFNSFESTDKTKTSGKTSPVPFVSPIKTQKFKFYNYDSPVAKRSSSVSQDEKDSNPQTKPLQKLNKSLLVSLTNENESPKTPTDNLSPPNMYVVARTSDRQAANVSFDESATEEDLLQLKYNAAFGSPMELSLMDELAMQPLPICDVCKNRMSNGKKHADSLDNSVNYEGELQTLIERNQQLEEEKKKNLTIVDYLLKDANEFKAKEEGFKRLQGELEQIKLKEQELKDTLEVLEVKLKESLSNNERLEKDNQELRNMEIKQRESCKCLENKLEQSNKDYQALQSFFLGISKILPDLEIKDPENNLQEKLQTLQEVLEFLKKQKLDLQATIDHEKSKVESLTEELITCESSKKSLEKQLISQKNKFTKEHQKEIQLERSKAVLLNEELQNSNRHLETRIVQVTEDKERAIFEYQMQLEEVQNSLAKSKAEFQDLERKYYESYEHANALYNKNEDLSNQSVKLYQEKRNISEKLDETIAELNEINSLITSTTVDDLPPMRKIEILITTKTNYEKLQRDYEFLLQEKERDKEKYLKEISQLQSLVKTTSKADTRKTPYDRTQVKIEKLNEKIDHLHEIIKSERDKKKFLEAEIANLQRGKLALLKTNEENQMAILLKQNLIRDMCSEMKELISTCVKLKDIMNKVCIHWQDVFEKIGIDSLLQDLEDHCHITDSIDPNVEIKIAKSHLMTIGKLLNALMEQPTISGNNIQLGQKKVDEMAWIMRSSSHLTRPISPDSPNLEFLEATTLPFACGDNSDLNSACNDSLEQETDPIDDLNNLYLVENLDYFLTTISKEYKPPANIEAFLDEFTISFILDCSGFENRLRKQFENLKDIAMQLINNLRELTTCVKEKKTSRKTIISNVVRNIFNVTQAAEQYGGLRQEYKQSTTIKHLISSLTQYRLNLDKLKAECKCPRSKLNSEMVFMDSIGESSQVDNSTNNPTMNVVPSRMKNIINMVRPRSVFCLLGTVLLLCATYIISAPLLFQTDPTRIPLCWTPWIDILVGYFKRLHPDGLPPT